MTFKIESFDAPVTVGGAEDASPFLLASDTHNIANNGSSFWDDPLSGVAAIPKFLGLSIASGVNQVYNIAPTVGNWFGGDFQQNKLADTLASFDSDLAKYYTESPDRQAGIDALGFMLSSLVPGSAGVKGLRVLQAGRIQMASAVETGVIGSNFSKATGLLAPSSNKHVIAATEQLISGGSPFSIQNANVLRALRADFGQNILEGAAFEVAVAATMYNSPVLESQDLGDLVTNMMWGAGLYGVIGGAVSAVKSVGAVKKGIKSFDDTASPWTFIEEGRTGSSASDNILLYNEQRLSMPSVLPGVQYETKLLELSKVKQDKLKGLIRGEFQRLHGDDGVTAELFYKEFLAMDSKTAASNFWELDQVVRAGFKTEGEKLVSKLFEKKSGALKVGVDRAEGAKVLDYSESYLLTRGANAGKMQDELPPVHYLADKTKAGTAIELKAGGIQIGKVATKISTAGFDIMKASHIDTEIRTAWARKHFYAATDTIIDSKDIPLLDAAYAQAADLGIIPLIKMGDITFKPASVDEFLDTLGLIKEEVATSLSKTRKFSQEVSAKMVNVKPEWLTTVRSERATDDLFADLSDIAAFNKRTGSTVTDLLAVPSTLKLSYKTQRVEGMDGHYLKGMEAIQRQQRLYETDAWRASTIVLGEDAGRLPNIPMEQITKATRLGAGASFWGFASDNYGSIGAAFEYLGKVTTDIITAKRASTREALEPLLYKLQNSPEDAVAWSKLMQDVRGSEHTWKIADGGASLTLADDKVIKSLYEAGEDIPKIQFSSPLISDLAKAHVELNGTRVHNLRTLRASQGVQSNIKPNTFYAPPPNPKDYPHFAFVIDNTVTGTGHSKMLYAATETELKTQMAAVRTQFPEFKVLEKGAAEAYYKSVGKFEYEKTLNENYIDTAIKRKGVSAPFLIKTDPKLISDELMQWHLGAESGVVREAVSHIYGPQFEALKKLGEQYTLAATSKYGGSSLAKYAEATVENPFTDYIKTGLGISKAGEYPFWMPVQKMFDSKVSQLFASVRSAASDIKGVEDLKSINTMLVESGYKGAYYDAALNSAVNTKVPRGALVDYVQNSNAVLSLFALGSDVLNAANNVIGSNVLLNTEIRSLLRNIKGSNSDAAGELTKLMSLKVPGTDKEVLTHGRLLAQATKNWFSRDPALKAFYKDNGFTLNVREQYLGALDEMAIKGTESVSQFGDKNKRLIEISHEWAGKARKYSGNDLAEEFNRFIAADVMKQITDVAVKHGVIDSRGALSYINTFVNRTQGNFLAAQRPMVFQGPVGQAIGLFQTYQFNLIQNMFRHVAEGSGKDVAMLLGLQGSIYGMNGLPAFNAINTHIIGNASGNKDHRDLYSTVYGGAGQEAGDWLMYGLASNMALHPDLKVNMYVRGDINPRHATVLPTNPADVPFINAQMKFFGNIFETLGKLGDGGNTANVLLQGIEHNGVSRPLAGLAQTMEAFTNPAMQVYSTSKKGDVVGSNDLLSLMTLGRLAGGKPLDEAVSQDAFFRMKAYSSKESAQIAKLGEVVKTSMLGGNMPDEGQIQSFMESYVATGRDQKDFNKFMLRQLKNASKSQSEQARDALSKPYSQSLQSIMGGFDPTPSVTEE